MRSHRQKVRHKCAPLSRNNTEHTSGRVKMRPRKQKVRQQCYPFVRKSTPHAAPESRGTPLGFEHNASFVILNEFSRVSGDLMDRTSKRRGVGER